MLRPDALLELVEQRRRLFIECEMGTHTIQPATLAPQSLNHLRRFLLTAYSCANRAGRYGPTRAAAT